MRTIKLLCILLLLTVISTSAQIENGRRMENGNSNQSNEKPDHKGSFLTVSGSMGFSSLDYDLKSLNESGDRKGAIGYGVDLRYSYFFTNHWGITSGVGLSRYGTKGTLKGSLEENAYYNLGMLTDDDTGGGPRDFELRARITHLEEKQILYMLEIPLMLSYQTYFCEDGPCWGIYGGLGAKLQLPVSSKYKIQKGENSQLNISGYYAGIPVDMGSPGNPPVPQHGFGTISDPNSTLDWDDKAKLKMGIAATAELGVMFSLGKTTDLKIGGYLDYGLTDIKKKDNRALFTAPSAYHPAADNHIGKGIKYNGMLNSDVTGKTKLLSFGAKVALYFKL